MNVDYRTIPQKDLAKFVLSRGRMVEIVVHFGEKVRRLVDVALVFVGKEVAIFTIYGNEHEDPTLLHLIKIQLLHGISIRSLHREESGNMEDSLITGFTDHCGHGLESKNVLCARVMCSRRISKLANLQSHM
ncbi:hypothetical protein Scep_025099 [Stephania cephalantha]|uniref:Uncharacterized protein n=1 Tax=Stephania cephalantha TaxID=152367 RepID=A0AAP0HZ81_9MAGN